MWGRCVGVRGRRRGDKVCQKNTSTLLLECTKILKSSIFISLFHTSDVRMDGSVQQSEVTVPLPGGRLRGWSRDKRMF